MKIIDKHRDYYDYLSHIYGEDKEYTFDRRGSTLIESKSSFFNFFYEKGQEETERYRYVPEVKHIILETGYIQYLFEFKNIRETGKDHMGNRKYLYDLELLKKFDEQVHIFEGPFKNIEKTGIGHHFPITITSDFRKSRLQGANYNAQEKWNKKPITSLKEIEFNIKDDVLRYYGGWNDIDWWDKRTVLLPILQNTPIVNIIPAEEIWRNIFTYITSLKNDPIVDTRTNDLKIECAGFDKKESFRNIK
jgi:hypothetical protein